MKKIIRQIKLYFTEILYIKTFLFIHLKMSHRLYLILKLYIKTLVQVLSFYH